MASSREPLDRVAARKLLPNSKKKTGDGHAGDFAAVGQNRKHGQLGRAARVFEIGDARHRLGPDDQG